ncbi:hypothetical protein SAMN06298216_0564 [Spirosomataceae bacterium TFI 002]|nr:hypothetical protein SAMN06298216_0564 [Spirosomataceae bacterium TFI 002]
MKLPKYCVTPTIAIKLETTKNMKNKTLLLSLITGVLISTSSLAQVAKETKGFVKVEAEDFTHQTNVEHRKWYKISKKAIPAIVKDKNDLHYSSASGKAYLEILPDTRVTHDDKLIDGLNFTNQGGKIAVLHYKVKISTPGRYYVWVRAFSTGSEDNGLHVGYDGNWPEHGQRMQWCEGKNTWTWGSSQRTAEVHCGVPKQIYLDINTAGVHEIQFSMREDGFEFDNFILTSDVNYIPQD